MDCRQALLVLGLLLAPVTALGSGPRFVAGPPFFTGPQGMPVGWRQAHLTYFTDAGDLSASVNHAAADVLVTAAASVWNVPVASITVSQGGQLAEDVNGQNIYLDSSGMVFPADVMSGNAAAVPIAVIYDADGAVTDTLLGAGASDPGGCRQNSVTESVDRFDPAGYILHAVIVLNGRCTGSAPELQAEMQYKLERVFGRVLGLAWSQTNDNVFTGVPTPTYTQAQNWPIMHPLDIICGPYSYQCLPNPFQLRADDIASLVSVYPIAQDVTPAAGKQRSLQRAAQSLGLVNFNTGEGMQGVNVLIRREGPNTFTPEDWYETSGVTGTRFQRAGRSPFVSADGGAQASMGTRDLGWMGLYWIAYTPIPDDETYQTLILTTEAVNPLYMGQYSLGPYALGTVAPSGSPPPARTVGVDAQYGYTNQSFTIADAAQACGDGSDGTASAPAQVSATGWWKGVLCAYAHAAYTGWDVQPGRTLTVEVTALNEQGQATVSKAMPVIGLFAPNDDANSLPSVGVAATAFQARGVGTTRLEGRTGTLTHLRLGIADERGDGRPDFTYQARVFYADSVLPARVATTGGTVSISGLGFRSGNAVTVNGVAASVTSWSANTIVLRAPTMAAANASEGAAVDVVVTDISTGATSTMIGVLTYSSNSGQAMTMQLVSAPESMGYAGRRTASPFAVRLLAADGTTPVAGEQVRFTATAGAVQWTSCSAAACDVLTDAQGLASTGVTPTAQGSVALSAADAALSQTASFTVQSAVGSIAVMSAPSGDQPVTVAAPTPFAVKVLAPDGTTGLAGRPVQFSVAAGAATFSGCFSTPCTVTADNSGGASVSVTPTAEGQITLQAASGGVSQQTSFQGASNRDVMQVAIAPAANVFSGENAGKFRIRLLHVDGTTPDGDQPIVFTAPDGIIIGESSTTSATLNTGGQGYTEATLIATKVGSYRIFASFGDVQQSVPITVTDHTYTMQLVSAPQDGSAVGTTAATPFAVRLIRDGVNPAVNVDMTLGGAQGEVIASACGLGSCEMITDGNGVASMAITPLRAGAIHLSAAYEQVVQTATFSAAGPTETIRVVSQPGAAGVLVGDVAAISVQLLGTDGTTVYVNKQLRYTVLSGSFGMIDCGSAVCGSASDDQGMGVIHGVAWGAGPVTMQITQGDLVQTVSFAASSKPDVMRPVSAPAAGAYTGIPAQTAFAVQILFADGVTAAPGRSVTLAVTNGIAALEACGGLSTCVVKSDAAGLVRTRVTPLASGALSIAATEGAVVSNASFTAVDAGEVLQLVSAPGNGSTINYPAGLPFAVRMVTADSTARPLAGRAVTFSVTGGTARLGICAASCTVTTDALGLAAIQVTPLAVGQVELKAVQGTLNQSVAFAAALPSDALTLVSAPGGSVYEGARAAQPLAVRLMRGDGLTPEVGIPVTFRASSGAVALGCGASACVVLTDASGIASTPVQGVMAGTTTLSAITDPGLGAAALTSVFTVLANVYAISVTPAARWVAEGAVLHSVLTASTVLNGSVVPGVAVQWTAGTGMQLASSGSLTSGQGTTAMPLTVGPLVAGSLTSVKACAWAAVCASLDVTGVGLPEMLLETRSGAGQTVSGDQGYAPVSAQVTDAAGNPVEGAAVSVYQAVTPAAACPDRGRCPAEPALLAKTAVMVSGEDGMVSVEPLTVSGPASETSLVFSAGTQASVTVLLTRSP